MKIQSAPLGSMSANFYLVTDEDAGELFVIDPGDCPDIAISLINSSNATLKYMVLTHAHVDHIGALDELKKLYDVPVVICREDAPALNDGNLNLCTAFGMASPRQKADILVKDGDFLPFGKNQIKFIHTPGHTKGSMCIKYENVLFSGDTIFNLSVGRCDFPGGSFEEITQSIKNKIYTLDKSTIIYPGHGESTTVEYEMKNNPYVRGVL